MRIIVPAKYKKFMAKDKLQRFLIQNFRQVKNYLFLSSYTRKKDFIVRFQYTNKFIV